MKKNMEKRIHVCIVIILCIILGILIMLILDMLIHIDRYTEFICSYIYIR